MAVLCVCGEGLRWLRRQQPPAASLGGLARLAAHEDWQVREAAAEKAHPDLFEFHPDYPDIRAATLPMLGTLANDPHPHVRAAAGWALNGPHIRWERFADHVPHRIAREPHDAMLHADAAAGRASSLPLPERSLLAEGCAGTVPPELLADPICEVRLGAVLQVELEALSDTVTAVLMADPCMYVRPAVLERVGPPAGFDLTQLDVDDTCLAAVGSRNPDMLDQMAGHDNQVVRRLVAGNAACGPGTLLRLGEDADLWVRAAAYSHPRWPADRPIRPNADPETLPRDAGLLAEAVLGSRTPVRCMAGRSGLAIPAGYLYPTDDAPDICDRDAVCLHSWGAFCYPHQQEVDGARQHNGADGYLGQRLASGVWAPLGQGGPLAPRRALWDGPGTQSAP